jgi:hypothetical protein
VTIKHTTIPAQGGKHVVGYTQWAEDHAVTGDLSVPGKVNIYTGQSGGWADIIGIVRNPSTANAAPAWTQIGSTIFYAWLFPLNPAKLQYYYFHIPHTYAPSTPLLIHAHWFTDGTNTATVKWRFRYAYAKGFNQGAFNFASPGTTTAEEAGPGVQYQHMVTEVDAQDAIPATNIEVDGMLIVEVSRITNGGTDNTDNVFLIMSDVHHQADTFSTKNRAPPFYT